MISAAVMLKALRNVSAVTLRIRITIVLKDVECVVNISKVQYKVPIQEEENRG